MPHNGNGKADRTLLKEMFRQEAATPADTPVPPEVAAPRETTAPRETAAPQTITSRTILLHAN